jgi:hypothetical protein
MPIARAIFAILTADAAVAASVVRRVFPDRARLRLPGTSNPFPQVCYVDDPDEDDLTFDNHGNGKGVVTVAAIARTGDAARALEALCKNALDDIDGGEYGGVGVMGLWAEGSATSPEAVEGEEDEVFYVCERTYRYLTR